MALLRYVGLFAPQVSPKEPVFRAFVVLLRFLQSVRGYVLPSIDKFLL